MGYAGYLDEMQTHRHSTVAPEREEGWKVKMDSGGGACREHHLGDWCGNIVSEVSGRWRGGLVARLAAVRDCGMLSKWTAASVGSCVTISTRTPTMKRAGFVLCCKRHSACQWPLLHVSGRFCTPLFRTPKELL